MSDLYIEARLQAIKDIASTSCTDIKDADNIASFCDEIYDAIPKLDKIVEELELHSFELGTDTIPVHYVRLNDAIEIVKQGGVTDDADVCEYNRQLEGYNFLFITSCCHIYRVGNDFKFCPNCGKKIKVIQNEN